MKRGKIVIGLQLVFRPPISLPLLNRILPIFTPPMSMVDSVCTTLQTAKMQYFIGPSEGLASWWFSPRPGHDYERRSKSVCSARGRTTAFVTSTVQTTDRRRTNYFSWWRALLESPVLSGMAAVLVSEPDWIGLYARTMYFLDTACNVCGAVLCRPCCTPPGRLLSSSWKAGIDYTGKGQGLSRCGFSLQLNFVDLIDYTHLITFKFLINFCQ